MGGVRDRRMLGIGEVREAGSKSIKKEIAQRENGVKKHS